jgi:DNA polymerase III delta subunit
MKLRKYSEIESLIEKASDGALLAAAGPDIYQSGQLVNAITGRFRDSTGYEILRLVASDLAEGDLKRHLRSNSLFSEGKLLVISCAHKFGKAASLELQDAIDTGITDCAIFLTSEKVPRESAFLKKLENTIPFYTCYEPFDSDLPGWVKRLTFKEEIKLTRETVQLITAYSGRNLQRLSDAITRLAMYYGPGATVDREMMIDVISGKGVADVFQLGDMLFLNRRGDAIDAVWSLISFGEEPVRIIAYLFSLWQKVTWAMEIVERGGGKQEVSKKTGARYPVLDKLMKFTGTAWKVDTAVAAESFARADIGLKTGTDPLVAFASLIFTLTNDH